jgi:sulfur carrier protein
MLVTVNGEPQRVPAGATVDALLSALLGEHAIGRSNGIAVAVAGEVVPRSRWSCTVISEGSVIEVLTAVQGG